MACSGIVRGSTVRLGVALALLGGSGARWCEAGEGPAPLARAPEASARRAAADPADELGSPDAAPAARATTAPSLPQRAAIAAPASDPTVPLRPVNATCPVMLGNPVDPHCTLVCDGRCIAFCDAQARALWVANPSRFLANIPSQRASANPILDAVRTPPAAAPAVARVAAAASSPAPRVVTLGAPVVAAAPLGSKAPPAALEPTRRNAPVALLALPKATPVPAPRPAAAAMPLTAASTQPTRNAATAQEPTIHLDLAGDEDEGECDCKDGSCRLPGR